MSHDPSRHLARFKEAVLSALDGEGRPFSVRQASVAWDASARSMRVAIPESLGAVEGPASVLCHSHDERLWKLRAIQLKGRLERRDGEWVFVLTSFAPPSAIKMMRGARRAARKYLDKRGLPWPKVSFDAIAEMWRDAARIQDP